MAALAFVFTSVLVALVCIVDGHPLKLVPDYYASTCPEAEAIVRAVVEKAVIREARNAASLLRLHFHDCFVNGCDGSVLLDDTPTFTGEKMAAPNNGSIRALDVVDEIKAELESHCHGVVSCADVLAIAARDSVVVSGGPFYEVLLGRRDSLTASQAAANNSIPPPTSNITGLISSFRAVGLSVLDLVVLSGAHTIGRARCTNVVQRLYNQSGTFRADPTIEDDFLGYLVELCPQRGNPNTLANLDFVSPIYFDNHYFRNLQYFKGLLNSDEVLFTTSKETKELVNLFSDNKEAFFKHFPDSMIRMGNISPLTGDRGEVRFNCRYTNSGQ
ncbi:hypothetical protein SELMODRAFT_234418 [Selaginella moellendorffii]|uniref:Peroxidase n=1 Tax=Selaginella moellendorffii TaxID=88036 RepID=D8SKX8_SELML|nr:peroxidase 49 [Selaginella moellendorffii]EFJ14930.1 hypothetical protein SELMODRAFT_234418 [Selaginella moellendorffii]|eukprot:XP_002983918.1 peroxidase 49 [Selaginella moellendorffii]